MKTGTYFAITLAALFAALSVQSQSNRTLIKLPPTVQLAATATDIDGNVINLEWRTTDGSLDSHFGSNVNWTLPDGPGIHFAYVLASDGHGGYTEKRVAVSTDDIGTPFVLKDGPAIAAPQAVSTSGSILRSHLRQGVTWYIAGEFGGSRKVNPANLWVSAHDGSTGEALSAFIQADQKGDFAIPKVPAGINFADLDCSYDGGITSFNCGSFGPVTGERALVDYTGADFTNSGLMDGLWLLGNVKQADGSPCGTRNFFFDKDVTATVSAVRASRIIKSPSLIFSKTIGPRGSWDANFWGDYYIPTQLNAEQLPLAASVKVKCEDAAIVTQSVILPENTSPDGDDATFVNFNLPNTPPVVTSVTASLNGVVIATLGAPGAPKPSDLLSDPEHFLSYKGLDSRLGACQYYRAIGAVSGCDADGKLQNPITFDRWKQEHKMAPYNVSAEYTATYVNEVDLNLTRVHTGTQSGRNHLAFVVCNYLGPTDASQAAVDIAVANARNGRNLVACVAMDYSVSPGVNNNIPFIKFHIFGPSGELLPSVNLDGRREKFVPGVCVACHGGEHYAGSYPENGTGVAHVGASYLPYDVDNFAFSSVPGLRKVDQLDQIKALNQLLLQTQPVEGMKSLIKGWYANGGNVPDETYVPTSYQSSQNLRDYYQGVIKPFCRTCHVAYGGRYNSEDYNTFYSGHLIGNICGGGSFETRDSKMPNSQVTYDKMMSGPGIDAFRAYLDSIWGPGNAPECNPGTPSVPLP